MMETLTDITLQYANSFQQLGIHKVAHLDKPLTHHMFDTYSILRRMRRPQYVCLAGLFHGSYGTQGFHTDEINCIPEARRGLVRNIAGERSEQLIYEFSVMTYESLSKSFRNVLKRGGQPELVDRTNGKIMPMSVKQFEEVLVMKLADVLAHLPEQSSHTCVNLAEEHAAFWEVVADHLGEDCLSIWNDMLSA
ncbi:DUF6817 domain-containing protein [Vibrio sp. FF112]|uniref:DUF6817 domain-containing protein n=1 Tax=Vibrio sp. FF112 TaxID=3230008 RepID=UPI00352D3FBB